ncbi:MAG: serine/threonine-protein phosphatase [bacterium]|nr:serine/threonine-protein phosphatase [bacterium]
MLIAISLIFAPIGVFQAPASGLEGQGFLVLAWAVFSAVVAVGWALSFTWDIRLLWVLIPLQLAVAVWLQQWAPPELRFEDALCAVLIILGYVFFINFIRDEGVRNLRLRTEIALAQKIHADLVPPVDCTCEKLRIFGRSTPCSEVGGDLLDVVERDGRVGLFVADVTGHGVPAAVLMSTVKGAIRARLLASTRLGSLLDDLNKVLYDFRGSRMFVTLACLQFDGKRSAEYALAGHLPIIHLRSAGNTLGRLSTPSLPLGVMKKRRSRDDETYESKVVELSPGDLLVLLTDGLTEVMDEKGNELGEEGIERLVADNAGLPLPELHALIMETVKRHGENLDDRTLLLARVLE